jgi:hypothetical protein
MYAEPRTVGPSALFLPAGDQASIGLAAATTSKAAQMHFEII